MESPLIVATGQKAMQSITQARAVHMAALRRSVTNHPNQKETQMRSRDEIIRTKRKHGMTLAAIGEEFGLTRERVRQIVMLDTYEQARRMDGKLKSQRQAFKELILDRILTLKGLVIKIPPGAARKPLYTEMTALKRLLKPMPKRPRGNTNEQK